MLKIKENEILANHSTFKIGGPARYFIVVESQEEIIEALGFAREKNLPFFILGGGSNVLFRDKGFDGLIIKIQDTRYKIQDEKIVSSAGTPFANLISKTTEAGLSGLEWGIGIPGTIGGCVAGNCGAYGSSISNNVVSVTVLNQAGEIKKYSKEECLFSYRTSRFKKKQSEEIIIEIELGLGKGNKEEGIKKIKEILEKRKGKIPPFPSAGSVFKNIKSEESGLKDIPPEVIKGGKIPVAYLIEQCGLAGEQIGGAKISEQHTNFIINVGSAKAKDVLDLMKIIKEKVRNKFNVDLEEEIIVV